MYSFFSDVSFSCKTHACSLKKLGPITTIKLLTIKSFVDIATLRKEIKLKLIPMENKLIKNRLKIYLPYI